MVNVFLEETRLARALGTAHQRERPAGDVRKHATRNLPVVLSECTFCEARIGIQHFIRMGEANRYGSHGCRALF